MGRAKRQTGREASFGPPRGLIDLNSLLSPTQSYLITDALAINERGQITGIASRHGVYEAFLATPIREVSGEVMLGDWDASSEGIEIAYYIQTGDLVESGTAAPDFEGRVVFPNDQPRRRRIRPYDQGLTLAHDHRSNRDYRRLRFLRGDPYQWG